MNRCVRFLMSLCWIVGVLGIVGCRQETPTDPEAGGKPQIALVMKSLANEFFKTMEDGARAHNKEHSDAYTLTAQGIKNEQDVSKQIELVEMMIAKKVNAIVIAPADSKALIPVCKKALSAGIVVVNIDNKFDANVLASENVKIPFVGPDNRKGAKLAGECLAAKLKAGDKVAVIEGIPGAFNGIQRKLGFEDAAKEAQLEIVSSQSGYWEMNKADQVASAILAENSDLKAFMCANDSMALGAVSAIGSAGRGDSVRVIGFDNITAVQELLKEGKILCTVDQHGDQLAVFGIEYALEMLEGGEPVDKQTPVDLITVESLKE